MPTILRILLPLTAIFFLSSCESSDLAATTNEAFGLPLNSDEIRSELLGVAAKGTERDGSPAGVTITRDLLFIFEGSKAHVNAVYFELLNHGVLCSLNDPVRVCIRAYKSKDYIRLTKQSGLVIFEGKIHRRL